MKRILCAAFLLLAGQGFSHATVVLSNLADSTAGAAEITASQWIAEAFVTGNDAAFYSLGSVGLSLGAGGGSPNFGHVSIFSDVAGHPGSQITNGQLNGFISLNAGIKNFTTVPETPVILEASTKYWIVAQGSGNPASGFFSWNYTASDAFTASGGWSIPAIDTFAISGNAGSSWTQTNGVPQQFSVETVAVPEARSLTLLALAGIALFVFRRRRACGASLLLAAFLPVGVTKAAVLYDVTDLGMLPGGASSFAYGVNGSGQAVGESLVDFISRPFLYSDGAMTSFETAGFYAAVPEDINNSGQIVGYGLSASASNNHAFLYSAGTMIDLGTLGGYTSYGYGINDSGKVVGEAGTSSLHTHAFLYSDGHMTDLGTPLLFSNSVAYAINASGKVVATAYDVSTNKSAYTWDAIEGWLSLGSLGGTITIPTGINATGQIAGVGTLASGQSRGFLYSDSTMLNLGVLAGGTASGANAMNDLGWIVGYSDTGSTGDRATLYAGGMLRNLNDLADVAGAGFSYLEEATDINNAGQIVGYGVTLGGDTHAFLLSPVPEPTTGMLLLAAGGVVLILRPRRARALAAPLVALALLAGLSGAGATVVLTTAAGTGADATINGGVSANSNSGDAPSVVVTNKDSSGGLSFDRKGYLRFDLSSVVPSSITSAALTLTIAQNLFGGGTTSWTWDVYGLNHDVAGQNWNESTITWNNAPANNTASPNGLIAGQVTLLGTINITSLNVVGSQVTFASTPAFVNFLASSTDGLATLILTREQDNNADSAFYSKEGSFSLLGNYNDAPTLTLEAQAVPEPSPFALLGVAAAGGALGWLRRRKKAGRGARRRRATSDRLYASGCGWIAYYYR